MNSTIRASASKDRKARGCQSLIKAKLDPYLSGRDAAKYGFDLNVCPFPEGDDRDVWVLGWRDYVLETK